DDDRHPVLGELVIRRPLVVGPLEDVREAGAATAAHADANPRLRRTPLRTLLRDLLGRSRGDRDLALAGCGLRGLGMGGGSVHHHSWVFASSARAACAGAAATTGLATCFFL